MKSPFTRWATVDGEVRGTIAVDITFDLMIERVVAQIASVVGEGRVVADEVELLIAQEARIVA